jgi:nicotinamidase-related amidase
MNHISNKALLIIDIQNDYFEHGANSLAGADKACRNAMLLLENFRNEGLPVVHIQHIATRADATFFLPNTKGAEIHANLTPQSGEKVIVKHFPNSFRETELLNHLKTLGVTDLVICGMMTHMCVDATTRAAKDFGFSCTLVADACASKNLEFDGCKVDAAEVHYSFLAALSYFYAKVVTLQQYLPDRAKA